MEYNEEQLEVINSEEAYELVRAPAGSGKTACLLGAIVKYRQDNPTAHIDAITFTRAATAELRERLNVEGIYDVNISTIHV
jgi:ATP-dependent exoDNAse (exonuclease V) beta subunit